MTVIGLVAGVASFVYGERVRSDERLVAHVTHVRFLAGVNYPVKVEL